MMHRLARTFSSALSLSLSSSSRTTCCETLSPFPARQACHLLQIHVSVTHIIFIGPGAPLYEYLQHPPLLSLKIANSSLIKAIAQRKSEHCATKSRCITPTKVKIQRRLSVHRQQQIMRHNLWLMLL